MQGPHAQTTRVDSNVLVQPAMKETALIVQVVTLAWYATLIMYFLNHSISRLLPIFLTLILLIFQTLFL